MRKDYRRRGQSRAIGNLVVVAVASLCGGCGMLLRYATPEEVSALPEEAVVPLAKFEDERLRLSSAWQFAQREQDIALAELKAVSAKAGIAGDLADWTASEQDAARARHADERVSSLAYCRTKFAALAKLHEAERLRAKQATAAATARTREQQRAYDLAVAQQERARMAAVTDRPGVLKEDRDKILARWSDEVARHERLQQQALIARRQAEVRAADAQAALIGHTEAFKKDFAGACAIDWMIPERGIVEAPKRAMKNPGKSEAVSPLSLEDALDEPAQSAPRFFGKPDDTLTPFSAPATTAVPLDAAGEAPMLSDE